MHLMSQSRYYSCTYHQGYVVHACNLRVRCVWLQGYATPCSIFFYGYAINKYWHALAPTHHTRVWHTCSTITTTIMSTTSVKYFTCYQCSKRVSTKLLTHIVMQRGFVNRFYCMRCVPITPTQLVVPW